MLWGVVDSGEKNVFKENLFLFGADKNVTGFEESVEGETFIDGHDLIADGVAGGVKREREAKLERMVGELLDLGSKSTSGDGDVTGSHT